MQNKYTRDIIMSTSLVNLELQHNNAHVWVGGLMSDLTYSPCDPFFFCHHAYIDYFWQKFRENQYDRGVQAWQDYRNLCFRITFIASVGLALFA
jgi:hypothetical protein